MEVGLWYTSREICDGQGLRKMVSPKTSLLKAASEPVMDFTRRHGTTALLTRLAMDQVTEWRDSRSTLSEHFQSRVST